MQEAGQGSVTENNTFEIVKEKYEINLVNSNSSFWWNDLKINLNGAPFIAVDSKLNVNESYKITQMIDAYHSYVLYHDNLVRAVYNKPLSIASLKIDNEDDVLLKIEQIEKDLLVYRESVLALEKRIIDLVEMYIANNMLIIIKQDIKFKFGKFFKLFKWSKHNNVLEQSLNITYEQNKLKADIK